jgi:hypothetical protein
MSTPSILFRFDFASKNTGIDRWMIGNKIKSDQRMPDDTKVKDGPDPQHMKLVLTALVAILSDRSSLRLFIK